DRAGQDGGRLLHLLDVPLRVTPQVAGRHVDHDGPIALGAGRGDGGGEGELVVGVGGGGGAVGGVAVDPHVIGAGRLALQRDRRRAAAALRGAQRGGRVRRGVQGQVEVAQRRVELDADGVGGRAGGRGREAEVVAVAGLDRQVGDLADAADEAQV